MEELEDNIRDAYPLLTGGDVPAGHGQRKNKKAPLLIREPF